MIETILVVDDQTSERKLLQDFLQGQGFYVITAQNGQDALYKARGENPDLILMNICMPDMDGYEFLRVFRQERQAPVILFAAPEEAADFTLGFELGADDCLTKPLRMRELVARIHAILRRNGRSAKQPEAVTKSA